MKPESAFLLESAAWAALIVDAGGAVLRSNKAAVSSFRDVSGNPPKLSSIWAAGNPQTPEEFLASCAKNPQHSVLLRLKADGGEVAFRAFVAELPAEHEKSYLLQLFP